MLTIVDWFVFLAAVCSMLGVVMQFLFEQARIQDYLCPRKHKPRNPTKRLVMQVQNLHQKFDPLHEHMNEVVIAVKNLTDSHSNKSSPLREDTNPDELHKELDKFV